VTLSHLNLLGIKQQTGDQSLTTNKLKLELHIEREISQIDPRIIQVEAK